MTDLAVDPWPERRRRYFKDGHPRACAVCKASDVDLHHRHYRDPRGWENDRTLIPLCKPHHRQVHRWHDRLAPGDVSPYRWLSTVTTFAVVVLRAHLFVRRPIVVAAGFTAAYWWAGVWLPVLGLVAMTTVHLIRRAQPT